MSNTEIQPTTPEAEPKHTRRTRSRKHTEAALYFNSAEFDPE